MTAGGIAVHLLDAAEDFSTPPERRRALCGRRDVHRAPHPGVDVLDIPRLCPMCARLAIEPPAPRAAPDPMLPVLRAAGLTAPDAVAAAAVARAYLANELTTALLRQESTWHTQVADNPADRAVARALAGGTERARDIVHARRRWPPEALPGAGTPGR